jgi:hypothetical protein
MSLGYHFVDDNVFESGKLDSLYPIFGEEAIFLRNL